MFTRYGGVGNGRREGCETFNVSFLIRFDVFVFFVYLQEGSIGHDVVIRPVPTGIVDSENADGTHHIVFKRQTDPMDQLSDFGKVFFSFFF